MKNQRKRIGRRISRKNLELYLDDIYNSDDPAVKEYMDNGLRELTRCETEAAFDSVRQKLLINVAWKFKHLLSPRMQAILEAKHPRPESI